MSVTVDFIFDFSGPNAYLTHSALGPLKERSGATFNYIPVLLGGIFKGTNNMPPMMRLAETPAKLAYENLEFKRFIKRHQIPFKMNPHFPVNTVMAIRGLIAVQQETPDQEQAYIDAVSKAAWVNEANLSDEEQLTQIINDAGLDGPHIIARTKEADIKKQLVENTENAVKRGAFGVPTFYVGDEMFFGKERLQQLEDEISNQS